MTEGVVRRSAAVRWILAIPFSAFGLVCIVGSPALGFLTLPLGLLCVGLAWWLMTGATDPPSTVTKWMTGIGGGLTLLMLIAGVVLAVVHAVRS